MPFYFRYLVICTKKGIRAKNRVYSILYSLIAVLIFMILLSLSAHFNPEKEDNCKKLIRRPYMVNETYSGMKLWNFICIEPVR